MSLEGANCDKLENTLEAITKQMNNGDKQLHSYWKYSAQIYFIHAKDAEKLFEYCHTSTVQWAFCISF